MKSINEVIGGLIVDGMSRSAIAESLGITTDTLANKTSGRTDWKWGEILAICELAGIELDELEPKPTFKKEDA